MSDANAVQVGGSHYQTGNIQHWDLIIKWEVGYAEGNATKYLTRWRKKNGVQDLEKSRHYLVKALEMAEAGLLTNLSAFADGVDVAAEELDLFYEQAEPGAVEELIISGILFWEDPEDLRFVLGLLDGLIADVKAGSAAVDNEAWL